MSKEVDTAKELIECYNLAKEIALKWADGQGINYESTTLKNLLSFIKDSVDWDKGKIAKLEDEVSSLAYEVERERDEVYALQREVSSLEDQLNEQ